MNGKRQSRKRGLAIGLAILGMLVSAYLELLHVQTYLGLGGTGYCEVGERVSCTSVALSGASVVLGVPMPVWGLAGFVAIATAASRRSRLLLPLTLASALASLALLIYSLARVGSMCMWCEVVHLISFALLGLAWFGRADPDLGADAKLDGKSAAVVLGPAAVLVLAAALFAPAYWMTASWSGGARLAHGVDENGRPWIGAEEPDLVIHEYIDYACPHCRVATTRMKIHLADDSGLRIVRHQQPRIRCGTEGELMGRCLQARAAMCGQEQGLFWEMDDWLFHYASGTHTLDLERAARDVGLDLDALKACMTSPDTWARAQADVDEARKQGIRGTPGYVIDGRRLEPDELRQVLAER